MRKEKNSLLLQAACAYRQKKWYVLPLHSPTKNGCSCKNPDCTSIGKHPRVFWRTDGKLAEKLVTAGKETLKEWFAAQNTNIGIITGEASGIVVLDRDGAKGQASLAGRELPKGPVVVTGKGRHFYFRHPGFKVKNRTNMLPGVDIRGDGGYVVAPPSVHESGIEYTWMEGTKKLPLPDCPDWLLDLFRGNQSNSKGDDSPISEGERNNELFKIACALSGKGLDEESITERILQENAQRCKSPLSDDEVRRIAASAAKFSPNGASNAFENTQVRGFNAAELLSMKLPPQKWAVKNILPEGLTILAGSPKTGKSFFVLQIALAIATGGEVFGKHTG